MEEILQAVHPTHTTLICYSDGRIYSKRKGLLIQSKTTKDGYYKITTSKGTYLKHRLIMEAFYGYSNLTVDHINGIKTDNRLSNLEYVDLKENITRYHVNTSDRGFAGGKKPLTKHSYEEVTLMREMHLKGVSNREVALKFGISLGGLLKILSMKRRRFT